MSFAKFLENEYQQLVNDCAEQGKSLSRMMAAEGIFEPLYLYARHSVAGKGPGKLFLVRDSAPVPEGVTLVTGEGLRCNVPYDRYYSWIYDRAKRTPILSRNEVQS